MRSKLNFSKILSLFFALITCMCIVALSSLSALAEDDDSKIIWVGGVLVTESNANDILGDATASYDYKNNVLTLKNANIKSGNVIDNKFVGIYSDSDLNLCLDGQSRLELPESHLNTYGVMINGNLNVYGNVIDSESDNYAGSFTIKSGNVNTESEGVTDFKSFGLYTAGNITVKNVLVDANAGEITVPAGLTAESTGIMTSGKIEIKDGGDLSGTGGDIKGRGINSASFGIHARAEEDSLIYVAVRKGGLAGHGGNVNSQGISISYGLYLFHGDLAGFTNDSFMYFVGGMAKTRSDEGAETYACSNGAYLVGGNFGADGGHYSFEAKECVGDHIYGDALTIEADFINQNDFGGYISLNAEEIRLNTYGYGFTGTTVNFYSESGLALKLQCGYDISDKLIISTPKEGFIEASDGEYHYFAIRDKDGKEVHEAKIEVHTHKIYIDDATRELAVLVADGQSINEIYCEMMGIEDFAQYLQTEKEGFVFEGWYKDEEFIKEFSFDDEITSSFTVYGKWTEAKDVTTPSDDIAKPGDNGKVVFYSTFLFASFFAVVFVSRKRRT